jgi:DNA-binding LacI/PurR family transcriptional regulator
VNVTYKHREIFQKLIDEIAIGLYDQANRLPSEAQLVRRFGVSRPTAARALRDLQIHGLIERRVGAGSFLVKGAKAPSPESSRQLGVLLPALEVSDILDAIGAELAGLTRANDFSLLWANSKQSADLTVKDAEEVCQYFVDRSVQGVFFAPFEFATDKDEVSRRTTDRLKKAGIAVVLLDRDLVPFPHRSDFDLIGIDNVMAGYMACEHLLKLGVRRITFIARPLSAPTVSARVAGARQAAIDAGVEPLRDFYRAGDPQDPVFVRELIGGRVNGVICANDFTAAQFMRSLSKAKIRVPEDIRLVGFDNLKYAELLTVPLTTVSQPYREMARNGLRAMLSRLSDPTLPATSFLSRPSLEIRASCGAFLPR